MLEPENRRKHVAVARSHVRASSTYRSHAQDVAKEPNHIACDSASRSEVVVPVISADGALLGVLDIDSPRYARFAEEERLGLEAVAAVYVESLR